MHSVLAAVRWLVLVAAGLAVIGPMLRPALAEGPGTIDYGRDIRPLLSENCLQCHGPDDNHREAGLRLDRPQEATRPAESGKTAIVPGKPEQSELVARIYASDEAQRMPPADSNKHLNDAQRDLLKRWIAAGAPIQAHWSLVPPRDTPLPVVKDPTWAKNEIDQRILGRLEAEGLRPSPPADRLTLIRRLYTDLIGLLPSPEEADALAADTSAGAYDRLVERLLDSPHYGERWARRWLDLARYADTNGYEKDRPRSIWPYRDWVVRALNADLPFDRFTVAQIAGDLLTDADLDAKIATGFHRNTMVNEEGGIDVEEFRFYSIVDRVNTTSTVWLGLTIGCAQCHNHKYDAITQREYYQLFALLNNADEEELAVPQPAIAQAQADAESNIATLVAERDKLLDQQKFDAWAAEAAQTAQRWTAIRPTTTISTGHATMTVLADQSILVSGDKPNQDTYVVDLETDLPRVSGIRLEVLPDASLPEGGPGRAPLFSEGDFMLGEFSLQRVPTGDSPATPVKLKSASHDYASEKTSASAAIDGDLDTGWSIKGRVGESHQAVFVLENALPVTSGSKLRVTLEQRYIHQMTIGRFRLSLIAADNPRATSYPAEIEEILAENRMASDSAALARLKGHYLDVASHLAEQNKQITQLRKSVPRQPTTLVMQERDATCARVTHLAHRGEYLSPRDAVPGGVPSALHPFPADAPRNRLGLARWLIDPANPLVARVTMNRHWAYFFGRGLVRTQEDFGVRGETPSHAELLDYLAREFVRRGWSIKEMHRLIVSSATYQQSSLCSTQLRERDPENVLLARGPRFRVEAEVVRDFALCASGLLNDRIGGPSVYPPQPAGVSDLAYGAASWPTSVGADRFRRGLYTYLKRTSPYAMFSTFDAPSGENCAARRERANTPLQALTMLNDAVLVEAARGIARRAMAAESADAATRAERIFRLCLTRAPEAAELQDLLAFHETQQRRLEQDDTAARAIAGQEAEAPASGELAAWTLVARAVLNLDEFITKQ